MSARRRAFTLVELLVAIAVIGILSAILYGALQRAQTTSRIVRTKSIIAKLNASLMDRWDSYRTRRLNISPELILANIKANSGSTYPALQQAFSAMSARRVAASGGTIYAYPADPFDPLSVPWSAPPKLVNGNYVQVYPNSQLMSAVRLIAARETMKYEMPQGFADFADISQPPTAGAGWSLAPTVVLTVPPAIANSYLAKLNASYLAGASVAQIQANEAAECLFMTLTIGSTDSGMFGEQLPNQDIGDVDGDGLPEFQDAWPVAYNSHTPIGQANSPIAFIRWAPGYVSELQLDPYPIKPETTPAAIAAMLRFCLKNHDFFDPLKLDIAAGNGDTPRGFQLTPLIYSAGPDGLYELYTASGELDPYDSHPSATPPGLAGSWLDSNLDGIAQFEDNVTNHDLDTRTGR